jgi:hypothetical protein
MSSTGGMNRSIGLDTTMALEQPSRAHRIAPRHKVTVTTTVARLDAPSPQRVIRQTVRRECPRWIAFRGRSTSTLLLGRRHVTFVLVRHGMRSCPLCSVLSRVGLGVERPRTKSVLRAAKVLLQAAVVTVVSRATSLVSSELLEREGIPRVQVIPSDSSGILHLCPFGSLSLTS